MMALRKTIAAPVRQTVGITSATLAQMIDEHGQPNFTHRTTGMAGRTSHVWVKEDRKIIFHPHTNPATLTIETEWSASR